MPKLPQNPDRATLETLAPTTQVLHAGVSVHRLYSAGGDHPTNWNTFRHFGPVGSRFDHHTLKNGKAHNQDRGILYGAIPDGAAGPLANDTCFAEFFQVERVIDTQRNDPALVVFRLQQSLTLLDLTGTFATRAGASQLLNMGNKASARNWSRAFYEIYARAGLIDGLLYRSSMSGGLCVALYEQAVSAIPARPAFHRRLSDPEMEPVLVGVSKRIGYPLNG